MVHDEVNEGEKQSLGGGVMTLQGHYVDDDVHVCIITVTIAFIIDSPCQRLIYNVILALPGWSNVTVLENQSVFACFTS